MTTETMRFERDYAFPRVIVWDALVDADLVSGWLAEAEIEPEAGGVYNLQWMLRPGRPVTPGRITELHPLELLQVETSEGGLRFELTEIAGGNRGSSTRITLAVDTEVEPARRASAKADWLTALDQLHDLLFGHPVDWANWGRDLQQTWNEHLGEAENSTA